LIAPLPSYGTGRENKAGFTARYHPVIFAVNANDITITGVFSRFLFLFRSWLRQRQAAA
jgi:hypothetical protein